IPPVEVVREAHLDPARLVQPPQLVVGEGERQAGQVVLQLGRPAGPDDRDHVAALLPPPSCGLLWAVIWPASPSPSGCLLLRATSPLAISWSSDGKNFWMSAFMT